jgi:hypothetical protein
VILVDMSLYLRVQPPPRPETTRGTLPERLARNVAVLFGVPVPDGPVGLTWASDYNAVTALDISRGAPTPGRGKTYFVRDGGPAKGFGLAQRAVQELGGPEKNRALIEARRVEIDLIPPASINEYGPDTKAAAVLTGADILFESVGSVFDDVTQLLSVKDEHLPPMADLTRLLIWAYLLAETFRCQPALAVAAVQARSIQRATLAGIYPIIPDSLIGGAARCEFGSQEISGNRHRPRDLRLIDTLSLSELRTRFEMSATGNGEGTSGLDPYTTAVDSLTRRSLELLLTTLGDGQTRIEEHPDGSRTVVGSPRNSGWIDTLLGEAAMMDLKYPYPVDHPRGDETWDFSLEEHLETLLPHLPTAIELRRMRDPRSQVATILTAATVFRILRNLPTRRDRDLPHALKVPDSFAQEIFTDYLEPLIQVSTDVLGDHPATWFCEAMAAREAMRRVSSGTDSSGLSLACERALSVDDHLRDHLSRGNITLGQFAEYWYAQSPEMNAMRRRAGGDSRLGVALEARLRENWEVTRVEWWGRYVLAEHNYAGLLLSWENPDDVREGLEISRRILPKRIQQDRMRGRLELPAARLTRQTMIRGLVTLLKKGRQTIAGGDQELLAELGKHVVAVLATSMVREILQGFPIATRQESGTIATIMIGMDVLNDAKQPLPLDPVGILRLCTALSDYVHEGGKYPRFVTPTELDALLTHCQEWVGQDA